MFDHDLHLHVERLSRDLRDVALARPRLDRSEYRRHGRLRAFLGSRLRPPAKAAVKPGRPVPSITIRPASTGDQAAIRRLAEMSERRMPAGPVLVAEVDQSIVAALATAGGPLLHDLWTPTGDIAQLLELRSGQIEAGAGGRRAA